MKTPRNNCRSIVKKRKLYENVKQVGWAIAAVCVFCRFVKSSLSFFAK
jgi:hypothetical protein